MLDRLTALYVSAMVYLSTLFGSASKLTPAYARKTRGAGLMEYAILVALAVIIFVFMRPFIQDAIANIFNRSDAPF